MEEKNEKVEKVENVEEVCVEETIVELNDEVKKPVGLSDVVKQEPLFKDAKEMSRDEIKDKPFLLKKVAKLRNLDGEFYVFNVDVDGVDVSFVNGGFVVMRQVRDIIRGLGMDSDLLKSEDCGIVVSLVQPVSCVLVNVKATIKGKKDYWMLKDPAKLGEENAE